jgi:predicted nucleic acid-binding Zn ribbon protein
VTGRRKGKGPEPLGSALQDFLEGAGLAERVEAASVVPEWAERVGEAIAAVTTPLRVSGGTLFVAVRSSAWLMELKLMEGEILGRLNAGRERGKIRRIRFLMAGESGA